MGRDWTLASRKSHRAAAKAPFGRSRASPEPMKTDENDTQGNPGSCGNAARSALGRRALETASQPDERSAGSNQAAFDQVWELVRDRFYDPRLNGLDWQEERARFRPQAASARSREEAAVVINAMLAKLGASHTHYYTPEDPAYYQLADIFVGRARASRPRAGFPEGRGDLSGDRRVHRGRRSGPHLRNRGDRGRAGARGRPSGRRRNRVGGRSPVPSGRFIPRQGRRSRSRFRSAARPARRRWRSASSPADLHPNEMFLRGLKASARIIVTGTRPKSGTCTSGPMRAAGISPRSRS